MHVFDTPDSIAFVQLCARKGALSLELKGLHRSSGRRTAYSICKSEYGLHGSRLAVYRQMQQLVDAAIATRQAAVRANELADWLAAQDGITNVKQVCVHIGRKTWAGALYSRSNSPSTTGMLTSPRAKKSTDFLYLLGEPPVSYTNHKRAYYRLPGDSRDWYVAGYYSGLGLTEEEGKRFAPFNPFGPNTLLAAWDHDEPIDQYGTKKIRMPVRITELA